MDLFMPLIIIFFFTIGIMFIVQPLIESPGAMPQPVFDVDEMKRKKQILYRQIKELETDFSVGKLSQEDYQKSRDILKRNGSDIIQQIRHTSS